MFPVLALGSPALDGERAGMGRRRRNKIQMEEEPPDSFRQHTFMEHLLCAGVIVGAGALWSSVKLRGASIPAEEAEDRQGGR